jgi:hypothetical protein
MLSAVTAAPYPSGFAATTIVPVAALDERE